MVTLEWLANACPACQGWTGGNNDITDIKCPACKLTRHSACAHPGWFANSRRGPVWAIKDIDAYKARFGNVYRDTWCVCKECAGDVSD